MNTKRVVEVFTAGCPVCEDTVKKVRDAACPSCEIVIYDLNADCETSVCRDKAREYGVTSVPAVAIDGKLASCCQNQDVDIETLKEMGLGQAR